MASLSVSRLRSSRLPLTMACPQSWQTDGYDVQPDLHAARLGTAVHEYMTAYISHSIKLGETDTLFESLAVKYHVDIDELRKLSYITVKLWQTVEGEFPDPQIEVALEHRHESLLLTGHIDVLSYDAHEKLVCVYDHKTGWTDADHHHQLMSYGYLALQQFPDAERVHVVVGRSRDFVTDHATHTREQVNEWLSVLLQRIYDSAYNPGKHCSYCPRRLTCPAYRDWIQTAMHIVLDAPDSHANHDLRQREDYAAQIQRIYEAKATLSKALDEVQDILKTLATESMGSIPCGQNYLLRIESSPRTEILFSKAWDLIRPIIPDDQLDSIISISKKKLIDLVRSQAGRGQKKHAEDDFLAQLESKQALQQYTIEMLKHVKRSAFDAIT